MMSEIPHEATEDVNVYSEVGYQEAAEMLALGIKAGLVPMLHGSPGIGKSSIVHEFADEYGLLVIDLRLSTLEPPDLTGLPDIVKGKSGEHDLARYIPFDTFPLDDWEVPDGYNGWLLFLDEMNSAGEDLQKAAYKLIYDRMIGQRKLHPNLAIAGAGNLATDNAIVEEMGTAMQSRLFHIRLKRKNHIEWVQWALANDFDPAITAFIQFKPSMLNNFDPDHSDLTFACQRTWEFTNRLIKQMGGYNHRLALPTLSGVLGTGVAREFLLYTQLYKDMVTMAEILKDPRYAPVPQEPSVQWALCGAIAANADKKNLSGLMTYVDRLPKEFQIVALREIVARDRTLYSEQPIQDWVSANSASRNLWG